MTCFSKENIPSSQLEWFKNKLSDDFKIDFSDGRSKVVFGYNGIGKTTLYKCLKEFDSENFEYVSYSYDFESNIIKEDNLKVWVYVFEIQKLKNELNTIQNELNVKEKLKNLGIKNKSRAKVIGVEDIYGKPKIDKLYDYSLYENFKYKDVDLKFLFSIWENLSRISIKEEEIKNKKYMIFQALSLLENNVSNDDTICLICGSKVLNLKEVIEKRKSEWKAEKSEIIEIFKNAQKDITLFDKYLSAYKELAQNSDLLITCIMTSEGRSYSEINELIKNRNEIESKITRCENVAKEKYDNICQRKDNLKNDLNRYFSVTDTDIIYDDNNFSIEIKFPRKIETYSTGEINLVVFLYNIYSFLGSEKKVLVLDDPVSSLDLMNHYKIAYELTRSVSDEKKLLILTHSVELLNTINSQYPKHFNYYYIDEIEDKLKLEPISCKNNNNVITINNFDCSKDVFVKALLYRESILENNKNDEEHKKYIEFFHYTPNEVCLSDNISNWKLVEMLENIDFSKCDFYDSTLLKIKCICALRIFVEKKLYDIVKKSKNDEKIKSFFEKNTLSERINYVLPRDGLGKLTREQLLSKKVMLNQGVHYYSQVMPMA